MLLRGDAKFAVEKQSAILYPTDLKGILNGCLSLFLKIWYDLLDMKNYQLRVLIEKDENGYFAKCLDLEGCHSEGETYEEVFANITDAISLYLQDLKADNELIKHSFLNQISLTTVPVSA